MYVPEFTDLVGDEQEFFASAFNSRAVLRRGALRGTHQHLLTVKDLDGLLRSGSARLPYVRVTKDGDPLHPMNYTKLLRVQGEYFADAVVPEQVLGLFRAGATVTWNTINHLHAGVRGLTTMLAEKFSTKCDAVAFLTPPGTEGFRPHHDPVDVFVVHLHGRKRWQVWPLPEVRKGDAAQFTREQLGEPLFTATLEPGDVMYMPYGTPHVAMAEGGTSLHLSVVVRPRMWGDLVQQTVRAVVQRDPRFAVYPYMNASNAARLAADLKDVLAALAEELGKQDPDDVVADLIRSGDESVRL
ncbi:cupin domain-containing protein [Streptomyces sp. S.PNR 29]|uniref:JmjC domain-containing protein n=1 Tax=Streptomyces sp. S.PNR 29 TaxID=2973805 RepID=UPI0025B1E5C3|nr:cupin domain-containing protein [Streptomyces sp. S.PNR 29]MDN0195315.1 cupin domain-containing protein [Streptomyces sp. S.PNR 29]